ncbi:MAG: cytochrome c [SAR324 cluster bacterium]|nr:cytochrome c [SAR324 cluster bacterium]
MTQKIKKIMTVTLMFLFMAQTGASLYAQTPPAQNAETDAAAVKKINRDDLIKYRNYVMTIKGNHTQALRLLVAKKINLRNQFITHAEALRALSFEMLRLFLPGSLGPKSRAKAEIWDQNGHLAKKFVEQTQIMEKEASQLVEVARYGSLDSIKKQLRSFEKNGCKGCHSEFRGEGQPDPIDEYKEDEQ